MKKFLTLAAVLIIGFSANKAKAQLTGTATLNLTLAAAQSISVTSTAVIIPFATSADYNNGVETTVANHISASSSGNYTISVKADALNFTGPSSAVIPVSTLSALTSPGTYNPALGSPTYTNVPSMDMSEHIVVSSGSSGANAATFNVKYKASGGPDYINKAIGTYAVTLTYTIAPL